MLRNMAVIGIDSGELEMIQTLVALLRRRDPDIPVLVNQALAYLTEIADNRKEPATQSLNRVS